MQDVCHRRRALGQQQDLVGQVDRLFEVVRDQHHGGAGLHEDLLQLFADEQRHLEIQGREGFVQEQHFRPRRQGAHDGGGLLLAAGQFIGIAHEIELDVEGRHQFIDPVLDLGLGLAFQLQGIGDVVDGAQPGEHGIAVVLEHVADLGLGQRLAVEQDLPGIDGDEAGDHVDQRGLAAAIGAEDGDDLVFGDVQVEILVQGPAGEILGQAANGDMGAWRPGNERGFRGQVDLGTEDDAHLPLQWTIRFSMMMKTTFST